MDFNQIRYFLALSDTLNFTRAAERCAISQPALTQSIKKLEKELGGELIRRDGQYTEITKLGKSLRSHFENIEASRKLVGDTAEATLKANTVEINVGLMCTVGPSLISSMLDNFQSNNPLISIILHDVTPDAVPSLLASEAIDCAFCANHQDKSDKFISNTLYEERMVVAFPEGHEFSDLDQIPLDTIATHRYIDRLHCEFRQEVLDIYHDKNLELDVVCRSQREDWIQNLIKQGLGVSCIPEHSIIGTELEFKPIVQPVLSRQVELTLLKGMEDKPALAHFISEVVNHHWS